MTKTVDDVYREYVEAFGAEKPTRTRDEIQTVIHSDGLRYDEIGPDFWERHEDFLFMGGEIDA